MCGEHCGLFIHLVSFTGSSPRVRGTLPVVAEHLLRDGIIPACAGNTGRHSGCNCASRDHPRVCGEHAGRSYAFLSLRGSSPRVRGTPSSMSPQGPNQGIIPACAGNTSTATRSRSCVWDHPRVCGEHQFPAHLSCSFRGSSPRVRGTPYSKANDAQKRGIIPACAGNTLVMPCFSRAAGDHPRVCGEHHN